MDTTCNIPQHLLNDLEQFTGVTLRKETLSRSAEKQRSALHNRLQPYAVKVETNDVKEKFEERNSVRPSSQISIVSLKSDDLNVTYSFAEVRAMKTKCGPLWRKEKGILRDGWCKYMAGLCAHFLVLYCSERDLKPSICLNIQSYVARPAPNAQRDQRKKDITFEIVCPGKRDFQFFARTVKDMEQWVASICSASVQNIDSLFISPSIKTVKTSATTDTGTENYDASSIIETSSGSTMFDEEYYDDIAESKITNSKSEVKSVLDHTDAEIEEIYNDIDESEQVSPTDSIPALPARTIINNEDAEEFYNDIEGPEEPLPQIGNKPIAKRPLLSPPATRNEDEEEFYNDIEEFDKSDPKSIVDAREKRPPVPPPARHEEEEDDDEIYHDISDYQKLPLPEPVPKGKNEKPPPLPARRPLPSIPKEESTEEEQEEEEEETYDDIGCSSPKLQSRHIPSTFKTDATIQQEEIYDDVDTSATTSYGTDKGASTNHGSKVFVELATIDVSKNKDETSEPNRNKQTEVSINAKQNKNNSILHNELSKQYNRERPIIAKHSSTKEGMNKSFLKKQYFEKNDENLGENTKNFNESKKQLISQEETSLQKDDIHENIQTNTSRNQGVSVQKLSVKDITSKLNQQKNNSFLHRSNSNDNTGNGNSKKLESSPVERINSNITNNVLMKQRDKLKTNYEKSENNGEHFQSAFKKIESSLHMGNKPSIGQSHMSNLTNRSKPNDTSLATNHDIPKSKFSMNDLQTQLKPPSASRPPVPVTSSKPTNIPSKEKLSVIVTSKSPSSASSGSSTLLTKSTTPGQPFSNAPSLPTSKGPKLKTKPNFPNTTPLNTMPNKSTTNVNMQLISSEHQKQINRSQEPLPNLSNTSKSDLSLNFSNSISKQSRNKPNGIPVTIPSVPSSPTSKPPDLPPRPHYFKR